MNKYFNLIWRKKFYLIIKMNKNHLLYKAFHPSYKQGHPFLKKIAIFAISITVIIIIIGLIVKSKKKNNNDNINDKINQIKDNNNKLQNEINSLNSEISQLSKKSSDLKSQLEKLKSQQNENTNNKEITDLDKEFSSLEKEFKELEGQEKTLNSEIEKAESDNKSSEEKIKTLKEKLSSLEKEKQNKIKRTSTLADSVILTDDNINSILSIFNTKLNFNLLYRASRDGKEYSDYKYKISDHKNLLIIGKADNNLILGGYTINNLEGKGFIKDKYAFLYNFKKEKKFKISKEDEALYLKEGEFPCFGDGDLPIGLGKQQSKFPKSYKGDKLELTGGEAEIKFEDIEIFYLSAA